MTTEHLKPGDVLMTGGWTNRRWWVVEKIQNGWVTLTELKWSQDMVNEAGCMRRGKETIRRKIQSSGVLYDWNPKTRYGSFQPFNEPVKVINEPTPSPARAKKA